MGSNQQVGDGLWIARGAIVFMLGGVVGIPWQDGMKVTMAVLVVGVV